MERQLGSGVCLSCAQLPGTAAAAGIAQGMAGAGDTKHGVVGQHTEVRNYGRIQLKTNSKLKPS